MKDIATSVVATALIQILNIVSGVLLARLLLPAGRGELAAVILWPSMVAAIGILGLHEAIAFHAAKRSHKPGEIFAASLALGFVLSIVLVPVGYVVVKVVFADYPAEVKDAAYLYLAFIPLNLFGLYMVALFQGGLKFVEWNILRTLVHAAFTLLILLFYWLGFASVIDFALASLLANAITVATGLGLHYRRGWLGLRPSLQPAKDLLRYGSKVHLGYIVSVVSGRLDQLLISVVLAAADLGLFVVAASVATASKAVSNTLGVLAFPKIANQATPEGKVLVFGRYTRATVFAILPPTAILFWLAPWVLEFFFGRAFLPATAVARLLIVAAIPLGCKFVFIAGLKAYDRALVISQAELVGLVLSVISLAVLLPLYGIVGAGWAAVISQTGAALFMVYCVRYNLGVGLGALFRPTMADVKLVLERIRMTRG